MAHKEDTQEETHSKITHEGHPELEPEEAKVFARGLRALNASGVPYMVGGAFAKHAYTGIWRKTKDLDVFVKPGDLRAAMDALEAAGFETDIEYQHWLAKAHWEPHFIDLIFGTGHGQLPIDDAWFAHSRPTAVAGVETRLIPLEELIVSTAYVAERARFDGSELLHLILRADQEIAWHHVLERLGDNRLLLLWYFVLFDFVYPGQSERLPQELVVQLFQEMRARWHEAKPSKQFRGSLLDPFSFAVDIEDWGYEDQRDLHPLVNERGEKL